MPYSGFETLANHHLFKRWTGTETVGKKASNMKLLLLGYLRYIGRLWTLDDLSEANCISIDVNHNFIFFLLNMEVQ